MAHLPLPLFRVTPAFVALLALGCAPLTREEAAEAVEEAKLFAQATAVVGATIELNSEFTIGGAVEAAAESLRDFLAEELPCAAVEVTGATLSIEYGALDGDCSYRGMDYSGTHEVTISKTDAGSLVVEHEWTSLSNGVVEVTGTAEVTWAGGDDPSRRVVHALEWTRISDGRSASGSGDRTQRALDGDLELGLLVDGKASWEGDSGAWSLTIDEVGMRWRDPVPESGSYTLDTPFDKSLSLAFERTEATTVRLTASSGSRSYDWDVTTPE